MRTIVLAIAVLNKISELFFHALTIAFYLYAAAVGVGILPPAASINIAWIQTSILIFIAAMIHNMDATTERMQYLAAFDVQQNHNVAILKALNEARKESGQSSKT